MSAALGHAVDTQWCRRCYWRSRAAEIWQPMVLLSISSTWRSASYQWHQLPAHCTWWQSSIYTEFRWLGCKGMMSQPLASICWLSWSWDALVMRRWRSDAMIYMPVDDGSPAAVDQKVDQCSLSLPVIAVPNSVVESFFQERWSSDAQVDVSAEL